MKNYRVTLEHIIGYYDADEDGNSEPKLKFTDVIVFAEYEKAAIKKAKDEDKTMFSVNDIYAEEAED